MGFLKGIFKKGQQNNPEVILAEPLLEHSIIIKFSKGKEVAHEVSELERQLQWTIESTNSGTYSGHELAHDNSFGTLYFHTPNADAMLDSIIPVLRRAAFLKGAKATVKSNTGGPDGQPREIEI